MSRFKNEQQKSQEQFFSRMDGGYLLPGWAYRLRPEQAPQNLNPEFRQEILNHFSAGQDPIQWHQHCNHALSSQVCCVNFLGPLMRRPAVLSQVIASACGMAAAPQLLPVGQDCQGSDIFLDFEWIGAANHLDEWPANGNPSRGANATSADAVAQMVDADGSVTTLLIEWKYTENYGPAISESGNATRMRRYSDKAFHPDGPLRNDLGLTVADFFWEPFYQLLRQQMLAWRMERVQEAGAARVKVLHISAAGNRALHKVTAPALQRFGADAFEAFQACLIDPSRFKATSIEEAFLPALNAVAAENPADPWAAYLLDRYTFLSSPGECSAQPT